MHATRPFLPALALMALTAINAKAADIHVPADEPTIELAINAAVDGDVIIVAPGIYFENVSFLGKTITLRASDSDPTTTVIDGLAGSFDPVIEIGTGVGADALLEGLTIRDGDSIGVEIENASMTIRHCIFEQNEGNGGGGISVDGGEVIIEDCLFHQNDATVGGGILVADGDVARAPLRLQ